MKIEIEEKKKVTFDILRAGQTFLDPDYDDSSVLMVVEPAIDILLENDMEDADAMYDGYAVDLSNGTIVGYRSAEEVVLVDATLTVRRI